METPSAFASERNLDDADCGLFFRLSSDLLCIADVHGCFRRLNPAFESTLGYPSDELLCRPFLGIVHPDDLEVTRVEVAKLAAGVPTVHFENRSRCRDGTYRWLAWTSSSDPTSGCFYAAARDVTVARRTAEALQQSQESLSITLDSIGDAVIATDGAGRVKRMNRVAEALTGWTIADASGRPMDTVFHIIHGPSRATVESPVARVLRDGHAHGLAAQTLLVARGGTARPIADSTAPIRDANGRVCGVVMVFRDTSESQRLDALAARAQRDFRRVIEAVPDAVTIRRGASFVYVNRAFVTLLGYDSAEALMAVPVQDHLHLDERPRALRADDALASGAAPAESAEWRYLRQDGTVVVVDFGAAQAIDFEDRAAYISLGRDLTERKRIEAALLLADRMVTVGTMAAGVAHEINNPLAYVLANIELATVELPALVHDLAECEHALVARFGPASLDPGGCNDLSLVRRRLLEMQEALDDARAGAERVRAIVRDLKTFSRAADDQLERVSIRRVVASSLSIASNVIRHHARLVTALHDAPLVAANESQLGQVVLNLLVNAAEAIPEGEVERNEVTVTTRTDDQGNAVLEVRDSGPGIPPEVLARVFDPFFTTKPVGTGTGLGLSICHSIVAALGGSITVQTAVGRGTTFRVTLPPTTLSPVEAPLPVGAAPMARRRARILAIDDEALVLAALRRTLARDHDVVVESSGRNALARLRAGETYDVILCDLMMPDLTGMDLYAALARDAPNTAERIVFVTGGAFTPAARAFLDAVPNARVEKPFDLPRLRALISDRLG